jgi:hypothetical protein
MAIHPRRFRVLIPFFGLVIITGGYPASIFPQAAGVPAKLTYSKTFKASTPEYLLITVDSKGSGTFEGHKLGEVQSPRPFQLSADTTERLFELAGQLHNFRSIHLDSHKKVASLGQKTLAYEQGEDVNRVVFNYTENRVAQKLVDIFEAVGMVEEHIAALEFGMKYDPLGLPQELLQIQIELDNKSLADPEMLLPTLEKIAHGSHFLHLAQVRAQQIIEHIQPSP